MRKKSNVLLWLGLACCAALGGASTILAPVGKQVSAPGVGVITAPAAVEQQAAFKNGSDPIQTVDPLVSQTLQSRRELADLYREYIAAKQSGAPLSPDLQSRVAAARRIQPRHDPLDQGGDDCSDAGGIPATPFVDFGTTTGYANDLPECDGSGAGPDVTYLFVPGTTADFHVSLCGSSYDTKIAVYEGSCTGTPIACNDDGDCWPGSDIPRITLSGGITYYFVIDGWDGSFGDYAFLLEELPPVPAGDDCNDPVVIAALPYSVTDASTCPYSNDYSGTTCLFTQDEGPDGIYTFTLTTTTSVEIILTAHYAEPPSETWVMPGILLSDHCPPDFTCLGSASAWTVVDYIPLVINCQSLAPGTYWVMVDNGTWFHPCYTYDLTIQPCGPCDLVSQPGDVAEVAEPFPLPGTFSINDPNGGCDNEDPFPAQYQAVTAGQTVFGRTFAYTDSITGGTLVDHDWYSLVVTSPVTLTCTYVGETSLLASLFEPPCPSLPVLNGIQTTPCGTRSFTSDCLGPNVYYVRISRGGTITGPDAAPLDYRVTFTTTPCELPVGRCCYSGTCAMLTDPECDGLGGYFDPNLTCDTACPIYPPNDHCQNAGPPASLPATFTGDNRNATNDCPQEGDPQVWHVFTTTEASDIQIDYCGTLDFHSFNPYIYDSCPCEFRISLEAVDWGYCFPVTAMTGLWRNVPAGTWYISITLYDPNSIGEYTIHVNAVSSLPPTNDECANAEPLELDPLGVVSVSGTTMNATATCTDVCSENGFNYSSSGGDVFYLLQINDCRKIAMALGTSDMHLSVYRGLDSCCVAPAYLCNDDDANFLPLPEWDQAWQHPGGTQSYIAAELEPGLYLLRVAKYGAQVGAYTLTVYDNGPCHCLPPDPPTDLTVIENGGSFEVRWSTDAASAARGTYRLWTNNQPMPFPDASWAILQDHITPIVADDHLYYSATIPAGGIAFFVVTGQCVDE